MIRHIVMWKFREGTEREQEQFLTGLRGLFGVIPQLRRCEVKRCIGKDNYDAVLVSEFASMEDLQIYKDDPGSAYVFKPPLFPGHFEAEGLG